MSSPMAGNRLFLFIVVSMAASISGITLNTRGCHDALKRYQVFEFLKRDHSVDFYFLQETHTLSRDENMWSMIWRGTALFSHGDSNRAGVAILFSPRTKVDIISKSDVLHGHLLHAHVKVNDNPFHLINVYAPTNAVERIECFKLLKKLLNTLNDDPVILGGDFNCTTAPEIDRHNASEPDIRTSRALTDITRRFKLVDAWRYHHGNNTNYTWSRGDSRARLDRIYINKHMTNRIKYVSISNASLAFSDHSLVNINISQKQVNNQNPVWCMNTEILEDDEYIALITDFWRSWQKSRTPNTKIQNWWDMGKLKIKQLTQQYCTYKQSNYKKFKTELENEIQNIEHNLNNDTSLLTMYNEKKETLANLTRREAKGAAIRSRHNFLNESDVANKFFFSLENKKGKRKFISHLKLTDNTITEDQDEICKVTYNFYNQLYSPDHVSDHAQNLILNDLTQLNGSDRDDLDCEITYEEVTNSVKLLSRGRSPGIDGLPNEFYQTFWSLLGQDLFSVLTHSINDGVFPVSCRRAVITLLPKKGDNGSLKNWRPVSLLCSDYKIFTKTMSLRLRPVMGSIIHHDQSCSVPNRHIHDNINLLRDSIYYANTSNTPLAIVALDQEKAFDRVHHSYLQKTLEAFGFGPRFISYINLLYCKSQSLVRVNSCLTSPISFSRGIRQGCSLSSQLYVLAIEPLLDKIRKSNIAGLEIPNSDGRHCKLTAYADDVEFFITQNQDFNELIKWLNIYERASNAKINLGKSEGLWVGRWRNRNNTPLDIKWTNSGLKLLGVYLGNSKECVNKNWTELVQKIESKFDFWNRFASTMSYRGRTIVINQLISSKLVYCFTSLTPPHDTLAHIQSLIVNFLWQGRHWIPAETLYLPLEKGGQNVIHLPSRINALRLHFIQRYLYSDYDHPSFCFTNYFFKTVGNLSYDRQLLTTNINCTLLNLPLFYTELLQYWNSLCKIRKCDTTNPAIIFKEPLFNNPLVTHPIDNAPFILDHFVDAGITKVGDLIDHTNKSWFSSAHMHSKLSTHSQRIVHFNLKLIHDALPQKWKTIIDKYLQGGRVDDPGPVVHYCIELHTSDELNISLYKIEKGALYKYVIQVLHATHYSDRQDTVWRDILSLPDSIKPNYKACYTAPSIKQEGDLQWRIIHGAYASGNFLVNAQFWHTNTCPMCDDTDSIQHIFLECPHNNALFVQYRKVTLRLVHAGTLIPPWWFILLPPNKSRNFLSRQAYNLFIFITAAVKLSIHLSRRNKRQNRGQSADPLAIFRQRIQSRIRLEFDFFKLRGKMSVFDHIWSVHGALCSHDGDILQFGGLNN